MFWCSKTFCSISHKKDASNGPQRSCATKQLSMVVSHFVCRCDCPYEAGTFQRLQNRIKEDISKAVRNQTQPDRELSQSNSTSTSAIGKHLPDNEECASYYDDNQISILTQRVKEEHYCIYQSWKQFSSRSFNQSFVARKNSSTR